MLNYQKVNFLSADIGHYLYDSTIGKARKLLGTTLEKTSHVVPFLTCLGYHNSFQFESTQVLPPIQDVAQGQLAEQ